MHQLVVLLLAASLSAQSTESMNSVSTPTWNESAVSAWRTAADDAADELEAALESETELRQAVHAAVKILGSARTADRLRELTAREMTDDALASAIEHVIGDLRFRPTMEADVPENFPEPAPVGEIVLKSYPEYRMARTAMSPRGGMNASFWTLFQHIKSNEIAMTAPVQIDYAKQDENARRTESMAFLYRDRATGETGVENRVEVVDVEPTLTISIGGRGFENRERIDALRQDLEGWLADHADEFEASGPMRTMGYNSPMMPATRRFYEVEIPVRRRPVEAVSSTECEAKPTESN